MSGTITGVGLLAVIAIAIVYVFRRASKPGTGPKRFDMSENRQGNDAMSGGSGDGGH